MQITNLPSMNTIGSIGEPPIEDAEVKDSSVDLELFQEELENANQNNAVVNEVKEQAKKGPLENTRALLSMDAGGEKVLANLAKASPKTVTDQAGPKPWSKEWVLEGIDPKKDGVKPLVQLDSKPQAQIQNPEAGGDHKVEIKPMVSAAEAKTPVDVKALLDGMAEIKQRPEGAPSIPKMENRPLDLNLHQPSSTTAPKGTKLASTEVSASLTPQEPNLLAPALKELGGEIQKVQNVQAPLSSAPSSSASSLSGGEFLGALSAAKNSSSQNSSNQQSDLGGSERFGAKGNSSKLSQKPSLGSGMDNGLLKLNPLERVDTLGSSKTGNDLALKIDPAQGLAGVQAPNAFQARNNRIAPRTVNVDAHVVKGAMARDRLSSESLMKVSSGIHELRGAGKGIMKLKLHPEELGTLKLQVATVGNNVSLKIMANNPMAREVLEGSMNYLRESLASQNLSLGKVDLSLLQPLAQSSGSQSADLSLDQNGSQSQHGFDASLEREGHSRGERASDNELQAEVGPKITSVLNMSGLSSMTGGLQSGTGVGSDGRLNVLA